MASHVLPAEDLIRHDPNTDCVCRPTRELRQHCGIRRWMYVHHPLAQDQAEQHVVE